jgi:hypothetical protein
VEEAYDRFLTGIQVEEPLIIINHGTERKEDPSKVLAFLARPPAAWRDALTLPVSTSVIHEPSSVDVVSARALLPVAACIALANNTQKGRHWRLSPS